MTPDHDLSNDAGAPADALDRITGHQRQQLSALLDGELSPDEARFLLRRLQHDPELIGRWERWQQVGDILRGRVDLPVATGFSQAVAIAVASESVVRPVASKSSRLRWGGAALAASAAMVALLLARQAPDGRPTGTQTPAAIAVTTDTVPATSAPSTGGPSAPAPDRTHGGELATALAVAQVPRRLAARRSRAQAQRAAVRLASRQGESSQRNPAAIAQALAPAPIDPFSGQHVNFAHRPWPKALLPASPATAAFTVEYGTQSAPDRALYPFAPRDNPGRDGARADEARADQVPDPSP
jgi:negative regulator of sigma E activity